MQTFINVMNTISSSYGVNLKEAALLSGYSMESAAIQYATCLVILGAVLVGAGRRTYKRHGEKKNKS